MPPKRPTPDPFMSIDPTQLTNVSGGTAGAAAGTAATPSVTTDPVLAMLQQITTEVQALVSAQSQNNPSNQMMQLMMTIIGAEYGARPPTSGRGS